MPDTVPLEGWESFGLEPERYELQEPLPYRFEFDRRDFLRAVTGGFLVLLVADGVSALDGPPLATPQDRGPRQVGGYLHIDERGDVIGYSGKAEVGQGVRTSLAQAIAEELRVPLARVRMVLADTGLTPYDRGTFGSRSTPVMSMQLRAAAAAAREMLRAKAAQRFGVAADAVTVDGGRVVHAATGRSCSFAELTAGQKLVQTIDADAALTRAEDWKVLGRPAAQAGAADLVTGRHRFASDVRRPGMLHGTVLRPPAFGATRTAIDTAAAAAMPGVTVVVDGDFAGVAAPTKAQAAAALAAIVAKWTAPEQPSADDLYAHLESSAGRGGGQRRGRRGRGSSSLGSIRDGLAAAEVKVDARFTFPYIAHAPLEPRVALAEWQKDGGLHCWTGTQRPFGVRDDLARAFRMPADKVRVIVPDTGSGYGGKHSVEAAVEAARLARAAGRPVQVAWTREEEFTWAYFRPAGVVTVRAGATRRGDLTAWEFHDYNAGASGVAALYEVPNRHVEFHRSQSPLRQGSYRALASTVNHFARETVVDELAVAAGLDPLAFRLRNLKDERLIAVLKAACERFGWAGRKKTAGRGFGLAVGSEKGGFVANCVEVAGGAVVRVVTAFECGAIVNPDGLENQVVGSVIMGLGGALTEAIRFGGGRILNPRFSQYPVPRFASVPKLETVLLDRKDLPSAGAGECPIVTIAPAVGNALFDATGARHRSLPMS